MFIIDDMSEDNLCSTVLPNTNISLIQNTEKKYALKNIIETSRKFENDPNAIITIIDGDDFLCNSNALQLLSKAYDEGNDVVWTGHKWDVNGMNISKDMPRNVDPYQWPWSSSHLRTFRASLLKQVSDENFIDFKGSWFKRGYDQALMLPLLYITNKRKYIPDVCYQYNINSVSIPKRNWSEREQISTVNFVRSRGFVK